MRFKRGAKMDRPTFKDRKPYGVLLIFFLGVVGHMVWIALPIVTGLFSLESKAKTPTHALFANEREGDSQYLAPYVPTPQEVVDRMLELAELREGDLLYDLGSGDGRIVITAARKYGVKAVGFEINPALVKDSRDSVTEAGLAHLVEIREQDIRTVDLTPASVLTMYLYPAANLRLRSAILRQLKPGSRVVSHKFGMGNWKPDRIDQLTDSAGLFRTIYLWRIVQK
jgi:SAM-dependent methyltransferase